MSNSGKKQVFESLDLFKFIMAVFVVDAHTRPLIKCNNQFVNALNTALIAFSVPFFFLASGFLLASKLRLPHLDIFPLLRKISTDIYFTHLLMWTVFCHFVYGKRTSGLLPFTATMLLCLIFSLIHIAVDTWRNQNRH